MTRKSRNTQPEYKILILKTLGITILAFTLSVCLRAPFTASTSAIFSNPEKTDFTLTDIYAQIANGRPVRNLEDRIILIDIGIGGREEIAEVLEILAMCGPAAVGLDVIFEEPKEDDSRLLAALEGIENLVLPISVASEGNRFQINERPFFYGELPNVAYGVINLPTASAKSSVRDFPVGFRTKDGQLPSFVTAIAEKTYPDAVAELRSRGNAEETIAYHSREYRVLTSRELADNAESLTDKIVLVGAMGDAADMHPTPINSYVSGLQIHASALSTLIDREWYVTLPSYADYILAFVICFLIVLATIGIKGGIRGLIVRLLQIALAYLAVRVGYSLFVDHRLICNFSGTLLMIAFGLFAVDLWNGGQALISLLIKKIKRLKIKRQKEPTCENYY